MAVTTAARYLLKRIDVCMNKPCTSCRQVISALLEKAKKYQPYHRKYK